MDNACFTRRLNHASGLPIPAGTGMDARGPDPAHSTPERKRMNRGDIIQITDENHEWYTGLLVVDEVKPWGVQAYLPMIPKSGAAFIRLKSGSFEKVGTAVIVMKE
jgi:hypothetical protein